MIVYDISFYIHPSSFIFAHNFIPYLFSSTDINYGKRYQNNKELSIAKYGIGKTDFGSLIKQNGIN